MNHVVVDGSNIATEGRTAPSLAQLDEAVRAFLDTYGHDIKLTVTADLGECAMYVRDILELARGSVLQLNKLAGEMADLSVNGVPFAKGEVVVLGDGLHIRIAEIYGVAQRDILGDD